jgi:hypothetical protein
MQPGVLVLTRRRLIALSVGSALALSLSGRAAWVQMQSLDWPNRVVRFIVPFAAGGPTDLVARVVTEQLSKIWGQQAVIENRGGGTVKAHDCFNCLHRVFQTCFGVKRLPPCRLTMSSNALEELVRRASRLRRSQWPPASRRVHFQFACCSQALFPRHCGQFSYPLIADMLLQRSERLQWAELDPGAHWRRT